MLEITSISTVGITKQYYSDKGKILQTQEEIEKEDNKSSSKQRSRDDDNGTGYDERRGK